MACWFCLGLIGDRLQLQSADARTGAAAQNSDARKFPVFKVDPTPSQLPNNWVLGKDAEHSVAVSGQHVCSVTGVRGACVSFLG